MSGCVRSKVMKFFGIVGFLTFFFECLGGVSPFGHVVKNIAIGARSCSSQSYCESRARILFLQVHEEMVRKQVQPVIEQLWKRALVELGRRYACPHGTEDHCEDIHFYQEGLKHFDYYVQDYPELSVVIEKEMEYYYRLAALICADKEYFSYGCAEEFLSLTVGRLVDSVEFYVELFEQGLVLAQEKEL